MNSDVVATIREALESRRRHTAELESINDYFNGAGYTKDEIARIDTALHALEEAAGWEPLTDGTIVGAISMTPSLPLDIRPFQLPNSQGPTNGS